MRKIKSIRFWLMGFLSYIKLYVKGGEEMMVTFLATRVVLGKLEFKDVPDVLKEKVKEELADKEVKKVIAVPNKLVNIVVGK